MARAVDVSVLLVLLSFSIIVSPSQGFSSSHGRGNAPRPDFFLAAWSGSSSYMEQLSAFTTNKHDNTLPSPQEQIRALETITPPAASNSNSNIISVDMNVEKDFNTEYSTAEQQDRFLRMLATEVQVKKLIGENPYALTDIPLKVMMQRFLDNLEDSLQKNNGKTKGKSKLRGKDQPADLRPTVIVLGTGWAAHAFIKLASTYDLRIVVVSPVNHFVSFFCILVRLCCLSVQDQSLCFEVVFRVGSHGIQYGIHLTYLPLYLPLFMFRSLLPCWLQPPWER